MTTKTPRDELTALLIAANRRYDKAIARLAKYDALGTPSRATGRRSAEYDKRIAAAEIRDLRAELDRLPPEYVEPGEGVYTFQQNAPPQAWIYSPEKSGKSRLKIILALTLSAVCFAARAIITYFYG